MSDKCGFGCKIKKFGSKVRSYHAHSQYERGAKRAADMGMSFSEYQTARVAAEKKGTERAQKERKKSSLKHIEEGAYFSAGGTKGRTKQQSSNISKGWAAFDAFMGISPASPRKRTVKRKSTTSNYVVVGGKAYKKGTTTKKRAAPRRRAAPRKQKDPFDYSDFW